MNILYFAPVDWGFIRQRPHHFSERLAARHEFHYVQPLGLRSLELGDIGRAIRRAAGFFERCGSGGKVRIINPFFLPVRVPTVEYLNGLLLKMQMRKYVDADTIVWVTVPSNPLSYLLKRLRYKLLVYELMDDYEMMQPQFAREIRETEEEIAGSADVIITTSSALNEKARRLNNKAVVQLVSNGVDFDFFANLHQLSPTGPGSGRKTVGFIGSIDRWLDFETISFIAEKRRDLEFIFIGPVRTKNVPEAENIRYLGKKDYADMPRYCSSFDVCLVPFKPGAFADTVNPVKLYEYFALGKPVVAYRMRELAFFDGLVYLAEDKADFLGKLALALSEDDSGLAAKRKELARNNDWAEKVRAVEAVLTGNWIL